MPVWVRAAIVLAAFLVTLTVLLPSLGAVSADISKKPCLAGDQLCSFISGESSSNTTQLLVERNAISTAALETPGGEPTLVTLDCSLVKVDLPNLAAEVVCETGFWGTYSKAPSHKRLSLASQQTLVVEFSATSSMRLQDGDSQAALTFPIGLGRAPDMSRNCKGAVTNYPEIQLSFMLEPMVYILQNGTPPDKPDWVDVPFMVSLTGRRLLMFQLQQLDCSATNYSWSELQPNAQGLVITGVVTVETLSRNLLWVMSVFMWVLAACTFAATLWWLADPSDTRADLLAFSGALLFALPTMRGLWPVSPPGGTATDVLTIFAQLVLVSVSIVLQFVKLFVLVPLQQGRPVVVQPVPQHVCSA